MTFVPSSPVLEVAKVRRGHEDYYLRTTAAGGAEAGGLVEPDGTWAGALATDLGLCGAVEPVALTPLLDGVDPLTGEVLDARHAKVRVVAFDCTFAAPKSVSVLFALGPPEASTAVREAHEHAVSSALSFLERNGAYARRGGELVATAGFATAAFVHRASRAEDPHLHTHAVVANLAHARERWRALDARPLFAHVGAAGALYRAELRYEVSARLGVAWASRAEGFADLIGIPAPALRGFSQRKTEIEAELARSGRSGASARRIAAERTREKKQTSVPYEALVAQWRERALSFGVARSALSDLVAQRGRELAGAAAGEELACGVRRATHGFERPFDRRQLIRAACTTLEGGAPAQRVERAVDAELGSGALVSVGERPLRLRGVPSGLAEGRFATVEVHRRFIELEGMLADAPRIERGAEAALAEGVVVSAAGGAALYGEIRAAALAAVASGRAAVCLAPRPALGAHLEATTGVEAAAWDELGRLDNGSLVVLVDAGRCPLAQTVGLLAEARGRRMSILVARSSPGGGELKTTAGRVAHYQSSDVRVAVCEELASLLGEVTRLRAAAEARGREAVVVAPDPKAVAALGVDCIRPAQLRRQAAERQVEVVVIGGAGVLGRPLERLSDAQRVHVLVAPVGRDLSAPGSLLEAAAPARVRDLIGPPPAGVCVRRAWRSRATVLELGDREQSLELEWRRGREGVGFERSLG